MIVALPYLDIVYVWTNKGLSGASAMGVPVLAAQHRSTFLIFYKNIYFYLFGCTGS